MAKNELIFVVVVGLVVLLMGLTTLWFWVRNMPWARWPGQDLATVTAQRSATPLLAQETVSPTAALPETTNRPPAVEGQEPPSWLKEQNELHLEVLAVTDNAWPWIQAHNQFNDPPLEGKRMVMVKIRVTHVKESPDEPLGVAESDFRMVGEREQIYTTFSDESSCGVVPDQLDGVLLPGDWMSGNVCFQVPELEGNLFLIYQPFIGGEPVLYFDLAGAAPWPGRPE